MMGDTIDPHLKRLLNVMAFDDIVRETNSKRHCLVPEISL